jgi:eukaryotic translation initiation factor 2C
MLSSYLAGEPHFRGYDILPVIAALNVVLAAHPNRATTGGGVLVGRNRFFFPSAEAPMSLGGGLEAWKGFYSSVRPAYRQLMVNVNVCTTAFYTPGNLADAMHAFRNASFGAKVNVFVKGLRVEATHLSYRKTIKGMAKESARTYSFDCSELGGRVTVEEYFRRSKQCLDFFIVLGTEHFFSQNTISDCDTQISL